MAIALPVSSTMTYDGTNPITSATFSPGADTLIVVGIVGSWSGTLSVSNSGTNRTWTQRVSHSTAQLAFFTAPNPTAQSNITVSVSSSGADAAGTVKVWVVSGQHASTPTGQTGQGTSSTNNATVNGYTSSANNSRGFLMAAEAAGLGAPTSTDDETVVNLTGFGFYAMAVNKAADTATSGTSVQFNLDAAGTGTPDWYWVALEIVPASNVDATPSLTTVTATTTAPSPTVSAGSSATPATVTAATTVPTPGASGGANATPATVTATVAVPAPAVTTDSATVVNLTTVAAATTVPAPAVQTSSSLTPATVQAVAAVWPLDVVAESDAAATLPAVAVAVEVDGAVASVPPLPGDQLDGAAGQIEFGGFVLGRGTPYRWKTLAGWREKPPIDSGNVPRASRHGSHPGRPLLQERTITWTALLRAPRDEVEAALTALELALPVYSDERVTSLVINDLGTPYLIYGRIDRNPLVVDQQLRLGLGQLTLQWVCSDPRRYNLLATGITVPVGEDRTISNGGNIETHPYLVVHGPATNPLVSNETTNKAVGFTLNLAAGKELIIDCDLGNATVDGVSVMGQLTNGTVHPTDFVLDRGDNIVSHTADADGVEVDVIYRDAWA